MIYRTVQSNVSRYSVAYRLRYRHYVAYDTGLQGQYPDSPGLYRDIPGLVLGSRDWLGLIQLYCTR